VPPVAHCIVWYSPHGIVHDLEIVRDVHYGIFRGSGTPEY